MIIAILEDNADRQSAMRACLAALPPHDARFFDEAAEMIRFLDAHLADAAVISLDHDLELKPGPHGRCVDPGTGRDVADYLATRKPACPMILASTNAEAVVGMQTVLRDAKWKTKRIVPFDDMLWVEKDWWPAVRRALARHASAQDSQ